MRGVGDEQERETKGRRKREGQIERYRQRWGKEEGRREKGGGRQRSESQALRGTRRKTAIWFIHAA